MTCQLKTIGKVKNDESGTTTMGTGMNYKRNSPIKAHPKSWVYLRHGLLHVRTLLH